MLKETGLDYAGNERLIDIAMDNCKNLDEFKSKLVPLFIELSERADEVHSKYGGSDFADKNKNKRKLQLVVYALKKKGFKWEFQNNLGFSLDKIYEKNAEKVKQEMEQ